MSLAARTRWTTRKSVVQYPIEIIAPRPNTIPVQCMPIGLSSKRPRVLHKCVKFWPGKFCWMRATMPLQPWVSIKPRIGISSAPNQMRKNCNTSLKIAENNPPAAT